MSNIIRKIRGQELYKVFNKKTGVIHSQGSTLENAKKQIGLLNILEGTGLASDKFNSDSDISPVLLPVFNEPQLNIPKYFIQQVFTKNMKEGVRKFKLIVPTTSTRSLATRKSKKSIEIKRVNIDEI